MLQRLCGLFRSRSKRRKQEEAAAEQAAAREKGYQTFRSWVALAQRFPIPAEVLSRLDTLPLAPQTNGAVDISSLEYGSWHRLPWDYKNPDNSRQVVADVIQIVCGDDVFADQWGAAVLSGSPAKHYNKYAWFHERP